MYDLNLVQNINLFFDVKPRNQLVEEKYDFRVSIIKIVYNVQYRDQLVVAFGESKPQSYVSYMLFKIRTKHQVVC